jgi:hypothetical protein
MIWGMSTATSQLVVLLLSVVLAIFSVEKFHLAPQRAA